MMLLCVGGVDVGNRLGLTLASKDTSTDSLADTDTETTGDGNKECSDENLEPQSLLLADAAPPGVDAVATTGSGGSALGSLGSVLVAQSLLGGDEVSLLTGSLEVVVVGSRKCLARDLGRRCGVEWCQLFHFGCRWRVDGNNRAERLGSVEDIGREVVLGLGGCVDGRTEGHLIFEVVVLGGTHC
jgi:hypothetical protein